MKISPKVQGLKNANDTFKVPFSPEKKGLMPNGRVVSLINADQRLKSQFDKLKCNETLNESDEK